ncbi:MAG: 50S ribosomal protein L16 [Acidobacteria bacterium]|nr:MAG: 50S ribosomal protein L16 [Acidobacteriota bacterium]PIE89987.1 MAG: 50S ribosomal protein L16 [Acidobacteriota bacterium]
MLMPNRTKYRKLQKKVRSKVATRGTNVSFGEYGMKAMQCGWITSRQIEAARVAMTRHIKRQGKIWIRVFPDKPITSKPAETRMGKGKGSVDHWVSAVNAGKVLFEMEGVTPELAKAAFQIAAMKLPIKTKFVSRHSLGDE